MSKLTTNTYLAKTATPNFPRTRHNIPNVERVQTESIGVLTPIFCDIVYPSTTYELDFSNFVRMDTSAKVPLNRIYKDYFFFFVPFRILDPDFVKVLGDKDPYDTQVYGFPQIKITASSAVLAKKGVKNFLPDYLGYSLASLTSLVLGGTDEFTSYPVDAVWQIFNDWFRDDHLDHIVDYSSYRNNSTAYDICLPDSGQATGAEYLHCPLVNKFHDYFTDGNTTPMGDDVYLNLGQDIPVLAMQKEVGNSLYSASGPGLSWYGLNNGSVNTLIESANYYTLGASGASFGSDVDIERLQTGADTAEYDPLSTFGRLVPSNLFGSIQHSGLTINNLLLAFAQQNLNYKKNNFGTRYIEQLRSQWGQDVPDYLVARSEYLGGTRVALNNLPVLDTTSEGLGMMRGNSATLAGASWVKSFPEAGLVIGLAVSRVKHMYSQGKDLAIFGLKTEADLYNPTFANIGPTPVYRKEIYNDPSLADDEVFNYSPEAWARLRTIPSRACGMFNPAFTSDALAEFATLWNYQDIYSSKPYFSEQWLKEKGGEVHRTLTGQLIPGATDVEGTTSERMFPDSMNMYVFNVKKTMVLPAHSTPTFLLGRL